MTNKPVLSGSVRVRAEREQERAGANEQNEATRMRDTDSERARGTSTGDTRRKEGDRECVNNCATVPLCNGIEAKETRRGRTRGVLPNHKQK